MPESKIKVKIGDHEFEAEGPVDVVNAQFESFKELIKPTTDSKDKTTFSPPSERLSTIDFDRIFSLKNQRVVSLNDRTKPISDAMLLILYGQKQCRSNEAATGGEIKNGLEASGYDGQEISRRLRELRHENLIAARGRYRAKRYHLTNEGLSRVQEMLEETPNNLTDLINGKRQITLRD